jgi:protein-L-isoaspartate(D-aspartate) O-methyltransferase
MTQTDYPELRRIMIKIIDAYAQASREATGLGKFGSKLMSVMADVPRHEFVPEEIMDYAYADQPLPIGYEKTTSQPFIIALMLELLDIQPEDTVLEVGTGLGYQAGIMSRLASRIYTMEIIAELASDATQRLARLDFDNVEVRLGNGYYGLAEHAPFDKIVVAAAPERVPPTLIEQLRPGGRMVVPLGRAGEEQQLVSISKDFDGEVDMENKLAVAFAPLVMVH